VALVTAWVESTRGVSWVPSNGGMCFPRIRAAKDSLKFARFVMDKYSTVVSPGSYFGLEGHERIGLGGPDVIMAKGLEMLGEAIKTYKK